MPLSCTSSPCNPLFLNLGARCWLLYVSRASYARVQATVGVGTVLIWDIGVAYTRGGGYLLEGVDAPCACCVSTLSTFQAQWHCVAVRCTAWKCMQIPLAVPHGHNTPFLALSLSLGLPRLCLGSSLVPCVLSSYQYQPLGPGIVLGSSVHPVDFLGIQWEMGGKQVAHEAAALHLLESPPPPPPLHGTGKGHSRHSEIFSILMWYYMTGAHKGLYTQLSHFGAFWRSRNIMMTRRGA